MFFCLPIKRSQGRQQPKIGPHEEPTVPISIYSETTSKIAMLWTPEDNWDNDIVSAKMVKELGVEIKRSEKDAPSINFMGQRFETEGHVMLKWAVERTKEIHTTRFLVATTTADPPFEVVLSRRYAVEYGLV